MGYGICTYLSHFGSSPPGSTSRCPSRARAPTPPGAMLGAALRSTCATRLPLARLASRQSSVLARLVGGPAVVCPPRRWPGVLAGVLCRRPGDAGGQDEAGGHGVVQSPEGDWPPRLRDVLVVATLFGADRRGRDLRRRHVEEQQGDPGLSLQRVRRGLWRLVAGHALRGRSQPPGVAGRHVCVCLQEWMLAPWRSIRGRMRNVCNYAFWRMRTITAYNACDVQTGTRARLGVMSRIVVALVAVVQ